MRLAELIEHLPVALRRGSPEVEITAVTEDSRLVTEGALFIARRGLVSDGRRFIPQAVQAGAVAVLTDEDTQVDPRGAVLLAAAEVSGLGAVLAERFHGNPSEHLTLVGVTGTNGKTTVVSLTHQLLIAAAFAAGWRARSTSMTAPVCSGRASPRRRRSN